MIKIQFDCLRSAAGDVRTQNNRIREAFNGPVRAAYAMDEAWDGVVSQNAMQAFYKLAQYAEPRYCVLDNFAKAMESIASGYEKTEATNISLADQFR